MTAMNAVPLFLQTKNFSAVKSQLTFSGHHRLSFSTRCFELLAALYYLCTFQKGIAWQCCVDVWTGYRAEKRQFNLQEPHQWKLLDKINLQKPFMLSTTHWKKVLLKCPEVFQYADEVNVKSNKELALIAIGGNPAMVQFVHESLMKDDFIQELAQKAPRIALFVKEPVKAKIIASWTEEQKAKLHKDLFTGISALEQQHLEYQINSCKAVWKGFLDLQALPNSFIYLKRKQICSPHTIEISKKGNIWVHVHNATTEKSERKVQLVFKWQSKEQRSKVSYAVKDSTMASQAESCIKTESAFATLLKGKRGIVQMIGTSLYPTKNRHIVRGEKTVLIQERYHLDLSEIRPVILDKWTEQDLHLLTLDLLYGLKAFKDANLYDKYFNRKNILIQIDDQGRIVKAGLITSLHAEELTETTRKEFKDPLIPAYEIQSKAIEFLFTIYKEKQLPFPEILKEGFCKKKGYDHGLRLVGQQYIDQLEKLDKTAPTYSEELNRILAPFTAFEHHPTKTIEELIAACLSKATPEMIKEIQIDTMCNEETPCYHPCNIKLKDGREHKYPMDGPDIYTLINGVGNKKIVKFYLINREDQSKSEDPSGTTHFEKYANYKDLHGDPWPYSTAQIILDRAFSTISNS
jgi:hypothetical protein